jgi:hypothetical protein
VRSAPVKARVEVTTGAGEAAAGVLGEGLPEPPGLVGVVAVVGFVTTAVVAAT